MDLLLKTCEYIKLMTEVSQIENTESRLAKRVLDGNLTDEQLSLVREVFEEIGRMKSIGKLTTPVSDKKWTTSWTTPTYHYPNPAPLDVVKISDGEPHWIYIHSPVQGRRGETYQVSVDCSSSLGSLPVIKAFNEFDFEVGHFYKVTCTDIIHWGANGEKKKYVYDIVECSEDEFMEKGFLSNAYDDGRYDRYIAGEIAEQYNASQ